MNCKKVIEPNEDKVFAGVFVCETCFEMAARFEMRADKDLQQLRLMLREGLRIALIEGRLQYSPQTDQEISKTDLLRAVVQLAELKDGNRTRAGSGDPPDKPGGG